MAASVWSGYLTFGLISIPVRLFPAARNKNIEFHMLHRPDHIRIKMQLYCPKDQRVVERSEIVKGYEYAKGKYVVIEPSELKKIEPRTATTMEILEFVKADEVDPVYFESSYYLLPEEPGQHAYALLFQAIEESEFLAIAKLFMHNREYTVILRPDKGGLMLHTMYYKDEVAELKAFERPHVEVREAEVKMAKQLISALAANFDAEKYHDTFEENVKKLVRAHLVGKQVTAVEKPKKPAPVVDIMSALKKSLAQMESSKKPLASQPSARRNSSKIHAGGRKRVARDEAA